MSKKENNQVEKHNKVETNESNIKSKKVSTKSKKVDSKAKTKTTKTTKSKKSTSPTLSLQDKIIEKIKNQSYTITHKTMKFADMRELILNIIEYGIKDDDSGFLSIDYLTKDMMAEILIVDEFTDIPLLEYVFSVDKKTKDEDGNDVIEFDVSRTFEVYDLILEHNIMSALIQQVDFIRRIFHYVDLEIKQRLEIENSLSSMVSRKIDYLLDKLPSEDGLNGILDKIPQLVNEIDKDKLGLIGKALGNGKSQ